MGEFDDGDAVRAFARRMRRLQTDSGGPSVRDLERLTAKTGRPYTRATIQDKLTGRSAAAWEFVEAFVRACALHAGTGSDPDLRDWRTWHTRMADAVAESRAGRRRPASPPDVCPYRGLETFGDEHAEWFQGRAAAVARVLAGLAGHRPGVVLLGPSGAGKSSLVRAGVLPALAAGALPDSDRWDTVLVASGTDLPAALDDLGPVPAGRRRLLVADQFEELLTPDATGSWGPDRQEIVDRVTASVARPGLTVLVIIRDDFYPRLAAYASKLLELLAPGLVNVPVTLSAAELRDIITKPAAAVGLGIQDGLAERVIADVLTADVRPAEPGHAPATVLPLLELTLHQLWQRRDEGRLTHDAYQRVGGVTGSLATWCDTVLDRLPDDRRQVARHLLTALVRPADDLHRVPAVRQQVPLPALRELALAAGGAPAEGTFDEVLATLTAHRVVITRIARPPGRPADDPEVPVAELVHEALLRDWGTLSAWIRQDHRFLDWLRRADERRGRWEARHDPGDLLRGADLEEGLDWSRQRRLPEATARFLAAGRHHQRAGIRRARRLNLVLAAALAVTLVAAGLALWQRASAVTAGRVALSRQLAAQSAALRSSDPDLAALLAVEAYRSSPTAEASSGLYASTGPLLRRLAGHTQTVRSVAFSPDGRTLASAGDDGTIHLWDVDSGRLRASVAGRVTPMLSVAFSPDGRTLASAGADRFIRLWDAATGQLRTTLTSHSHYVNSVAFSPDGRFLASGGSDAKVLVWDPVTGGLRATLTGHTGVVYAVAFSPDGHALASASTDGTGVIWDVAGRKPRVKLAGRGGSMLAVGFSPDGKILASGGRDGVIRLWDATTGRLRSSLAGHSRFVYTVGFSPDGRTLASGGDDNTARLWDVATGQTRTVLIGDVHSAVFSPDGHTLATGGGAVSLWDPSSGQSRATLSSPAIVNAVAFSPDGRLVAGASEDKTVRLWDAATGRVRATLTGHTAAVDAVAFSPDGRLVAAGGEDKTVRLWDTATGRPGATLTGHTNFVYALAFSPDGHTLATASLDKTVRLWDVTTGRVRATLTGHTAAVDAVAFSPDGRTVAGGGLDRTVRLWDAATGRARATLTGHGGVVGSLAFSPDGRTLASGGTDGAVRLWDMPGGAPRLTMTDQTSPVYSVAFSPDGRAVATGSDDKAVRLWDPATGQLRATLTGLTAAVGAVAFSPDGHTLATGDDKTIRLWDVTLPAPATVVDGICHAVNRNLTAQERALYLPASQAPGPTCPFVRR